MKKRTTLFALVLMAFMGVSAQEWKAVDSVEVEEAPDTVSCNEQESMGEIIPQVPFGELDSLVMKSLDDRYVVVYKDGRCGIYDLMKEENVTKIDYASLRYSFRKELEGNFYTYFVWENEDLMGIIGIAEVNNQFVAISMPKEDEQE